MLLPSTQQEYMRVLFLYLLGTRRERGSHEGEGEGLGGRGQMGEMENLEHTSCFASPSQQGHQERMVRGRSGRQTD